MAEKGTNPSDGMLKVEQRSASELKKHYEEVGERFVFVDHKNNPDAGMYVIVREVKNVKNPRMRLDVHRHSVDNVMMFLGDDPGLKGLSAEVSIGDKKHIVNSPASVYVPAGVNHTYRFVEGSGKYVNVVLAPGGNYNAVTS